MKNKLSLTPLYLVAIGFLAQADTLDARPCGEVLRCPTTSTFSNDQKQYIDRVRAWWREQNP